MVYSILIFQIYQSAYEQNEDQINLQCCHKSCLKCIGSKPEDCNPTQCYKEEGYHFDKKNQLCCSQDCLSCKNDPNYCVRCMVYDQFSNNGVCENKCPVDQQSYINVEEDIRICQICQFMGTHVIIYNTTDKQDYCVEKEYIEVNFTEIQHWFQYQISFSIYWKAFLNETFQQQLKVQLNQKSLEALNVKMTLKNYSPTLFNIQLEYPENFEILPQSILNLSFVVPIYLQQDYPQMILLNNNQSFKLNHYIKCSKIKHFKYNACINKEKMYSNLEPLKSNIYLFSFYNESQYQEKKIFLEDQKSKNINTEYLELKAIQKLQQLEKFKSLTLTQLQAYKFNFEWEEFKYYFLQNKLQNDLTFNRDFLNSFQQTFQFFSLEVLEEQTLNLKNQIYNISYINYTNSFLIEFNFSNNIINYPYLVFGFNLSQTSIRLEFQQYYFEQQASSSIMQEYIKLSSKQNSILNVQFYLLNIFAYLNTGTAVFLLIFSKGSRSHSWRALMYVEIINLAKYFSINFPLTAKENYQNFVKLPQFILSKNTIQDSEEGLYKLPKAFRQYGTSPYWINNFADQAVWLIISLIIGILIILIKSLLQQSQKQNQFFPYIFINYIYPTIVWNGVTVFWISNQSRSIIYIFLTFIYSPLALEHGLLNIICAGFWCFIEILFLLTFPLVIYQIRSLKQDLHIFGMVESKETGKFQKLENIHDMISPNSTYARLRADKDYQQKLVQESKIIKHSFLHDSFSVIFYDFKQNSILTNYFIILDLLRIILKAIFQSVLSNQPILQSSCYAFISFAYLICFLTFNPFTNKNYWFTSLLCELLLFIVEICAFLICFFDVRKIYNNINQRLLAGSVMIFCSIICLMISTTYAFFIGLQQFGKSLYRFSLLKNERTIQARQELNMLQQDITYDQPKQLQQKEQEERKQIFGIGSPKISETKTRNYDNSLSRISEQQVSQSPKTTNINSAISNKINSAFQIQQPIQSSLSQSRKKRRELGQIRPTLIEQLQKDFEEDDEIKVEQQQQDIQRGKILSQNYFKSRQSLWNKGGIKQILANENEENKNIIQIKKKEQISSDSEDGETNINFDKIYQEAIQQNKINDRYKKLSKFYVK